MAITYFGRTQVPAADDGTNANTATLTPPASMLAGDLVLLHAVLRQSSATLDITTAGGQTWFAYTQTNGTTCRTRFWWCVYNGTWGANPVITDSSAGGLALTANMTVFRPTSASYNWHVSGPYAQATYSAPTTPFDQSRTGVTSVIDGSVCVAWWVSVDNNTWALQTGGGWTNPGSVTQTRNSTGSDNSLSIAYLIQSSAGASGAVVNRQTAVGGDAGVNGIIAFGESLPVDTGTMSDGVTEVSIADPPSLINITLTETTDLDTGGSASKSGSDTAALSESPAIALAPAQAETGSLGETPALATTSEETGTAAEQVDGIALGPTDSFGQADGVPGIALDGVADTGTLTDTETVDTGTVNTPITDSDTGTLVEQVTGIALGSEDTLGQSDGVPGIAPDATADTGTLDEAGSVSALGNQTLADSDSGSLADLADSIALTGPSDEATASEPAPEIALGPDDAFGQSDGISGIALDGVADAAALSESAALVQQSTTPTDSDTFTLTEPLEGLEELDRTPPVVIEQQGFLPFWYTQGMKPAPTFAVRHQRDEIERLACAEHAEVGVTLVGDPRAGDDIEEENARILALVAALL